MVDLRYYDDSGNETFMDIGDYDGLPSMLRFDSGYF